MVKCNDIPTGARRDRVLAADCFQTVILQTFLPFIQGKSADLPPRPFLLTFDDGRLDSWTGADSILKQLGFTAVIFVDVDPVDTRHPEYLLWKELQTMQQSGRWDVQLHAGRGHTFIRWGPGPDDYGPFYAYKRNGESFEGWQERAFGDIEWGQEQLAKHISQYQPRAFAPPYGAYGQESWSPTCQPPTCTNDSRIPNTLLTWLTGRFYLVFTQDRSWFAKPDSPQPIGRFQLNRNTSLKQLHDVLVGK